MGSVCGISLCFGVVALLTLPGCGGGSSSATTPTSDSNERRIQATLETVSEHPDCTALLPFYWEIGGSDGPLVGRTEGGNLPSASTVVSIASASKWLYSTYWVQRTNGRLAAEYIPYLNLTSGYTQFAATGCLGSRTVKDCAALGDNGALNPAAVGLFDYGGGHMQKHAAQDARLGPMDAGQLAAEIRSQLGPTVNLAYGQPQVAGGGRMSAEDYAKVLRSILSGELQMKSVLGAYAVCVDPRTCMTSISTPSPPGEKWHYSIGHWVEDDPVHGDGAYSSLGAFGFYPWIDSSKTWYGVIAREDLLGGRSSLACGRLIRRAWVTGVPQ